MNQRPDSPDQWTIIKLLRWATTYFSEHRVESPRASAEILLAHVLGIRRIDLYLKYDQPLHDSELASFKECLKRRIKREPVSYIVGSREFWSLDFMVTPDVLIPRPETECLVEQVLKIESEIAADRPLRILDLGTGSGAIVVSLAREKTRHLFYASDRSSQALGVARRNARHLASGSRIHFFCGDWCAPLKNTFFFDIIVSNPPYIVTGDIAGLEPEITEYEPHGALDGAADGLSCIRRIVRTAPDHLVAGGYLVLEMGWDQRSGVELAALEAGGFDDFRVIKDYGGHDRIVRLRKGALQ